MRRRVILLAVLSSLLLLGTASAEEVCNHYGTKIKTWFEGYGYACAGYGMGCTECVDTETGASCTANGNKPCGPLVKHPL